MHGSKGPPGMWEHGRTLIRTFFSFFLSSCCYLQLCSPVCSPVFCCYLQLCSPVFASPLMLGLMWLPQQPVELVPLHLPYQTLNPEL